MSFFQSEEEKREENRIEEAVHNIANWIVDTLKDEGLLTLYLAGTIMDKNERVSGSDIDFFAIVQ